MSDELHDLIVHTIGQGNTKESLRLLKKMREEIDTAENFSNELAIIFFEEMWHYKDAIDVWKQIVKKYKSDIQEFDALNMARHATVTDQFEFVTALLDNGIAIDFSDEDVLFGSMMCGPFEVCETLDQYWENDSHYSVLAIAAAFNDDERVLEHVLNILDDHEVLEEIHATRPTNTVSWGEEMVIHASDDILDELTAKINEIQARRISKNISSSQLSSQRKM